MQLVVTKFPPQNGFSFMFDAKPEVKTIVDDHYYKAKGVIDRRWPGKLTPLSFRRFLFWRIEDLFNPSVKRSIVPTGSS